MEDDVIELSINPYDDLPVEAADALERFVIDAPIDEVFERIDLIEALTEAWSEGPPPLDLSSDFTWESFDNAECDGEVDVDSAVTRTVPATVLRDLGVRVADDSEELRRRICAINELVSRWASIYASHERALGHFLLCHAADAANIELSHDALLGVHKSYHQRLREGGRRVEL